jgi:hypothetical protein
MQQFSPLAVLFVGVAGALWDTTQLGDVVVATLYRARTPHRCCDLEFLYAATAGHDHRPWCSVSCT